MITDLYPQTPWKGIWKKREFHERKGSFERRGKGDIDGGNGIRTEEACTSPTAFVNLDGEGELS